MKQKPTDYRNRIKALEYVNAGENLSRQCRAVEISAGYVAVALQRYLDTFGIRAELITDGRAEG